MRFLVGGSRVEFVVRCRDLGKMLDRIIFGPRVLSHRFMQHCTKLWGSATGSSSSIFDDTS